MKTMCPGQDTRYWRPGDIFNVPCSSCGKEVEFFKDDAKRRCSRCGGIVQNPRLSRGCARWCEHARECLGYEPADSNGEKENTDSSIADAIIESIRYEFGTGSTVAKEAIRAAERAAVILKSVPAKPRVAIPAVLLLMVDRNSTGGMNSTPTGVIQFPVARKILKASGSDPDDIDNILNILRAYHEGAPDNSPEYRAVAGSRLEY